MFTSKVQLESYHRILIEFLRFKEIKYILPLEIYFSMLNIDLFIENLYLASDEQISIKRKYVLRFLETTEKDDYGAKSRRILLFK